MPNNWRFIPATGHDSGGSSTHQIWKIMDNGHDNNKLDNLIQNVESARDEFNTEKTAMRSQVQAEMQKLVSLRSKQLAGC